MKITLENLSKKYHREWIFKDINLEFKTGTSYAITGPNGSGKSTLLQIISGAILQSSGDITYNNSNIIPVEEIYQHISFASPYLELIEEFTLSEFLQFHYKFKPLADGIDLDGILRESHLESSKNKFIKKFSSGMKQRLKLALCFYSNSPIILLDEPTSNLDQEGVNWYKKNITTLPQNKLTIIASNQPEEYTHCSEVININKYKE